MAGRLFLTPGSLFSRRGTLFRSEVTDLVTDAYRVVAPKRLAAALDGSPRPLSHHEDVAENRVVNSERLLIESRGNDLRTRAADGLRMHFGGKDPVLLEFGVRPRRGGSRRRAAPPAQPAPQPTPAPPGDPDSSA